MTIFKFGEHILENVDLYIYLDILLHQNEKIQTYTEAFSRIRFKVVIWLKQNVSFGGLIKLLMLTWFILNFLDLFCLYDARTLRVSTLAI